jgi:lipoprotein-anchoring transpeptidase ErfK/SrfK
MLGPDGLHCASERAGAEAALRRRPGVVSATVNPVAQTAPVTSDTLRTRMITPTDPRMSASHGAGSRQVGSCDLLLTTNADSLGLDGIRFLPAQEDARAADREQWDDPNNVLPVTHGVVVGSRSGHSRRSIIVKWNGLALLALAVVVTGCSVAEPVSAPAQHPGVVQPQPSAMPSATVAASASPRPTTMPSATVAASPSPRPSPSHLTVLPSPSREPAYDIAAVQARLAALHYYGGAVDGVFGADMRAAVVAFQKVQEISADAVIGKDTLLSLARPRTPSLRASSPSERVEVDLTRQVLYVVVAGNITRIMALSSGDGRSYQSNGSTETALTPVGWYKIQRRVLGTDKAPLGTLYDPQYFYRGWAIHGSDSVPAYPASHGCVRVTRPDAQYLLGALNLGTSVYLYGGAHTFTAGSPTADSAAPGA